MKQLFAKSAIASVLMLALLAMPAGWAQNNFSALESAGHPPLNRAPKGHVQAEPVASVTALQPGQTLWLGVSFQIDPHWHIYWQNSGDVGYATEVTWELPEGFEILTQDVWPAPHRFDDAELISYGYHDRVILPIQVKVPGELNQSEVTLRARASWLACRSECIPGSQELSLTLPVGPASPSQQAGAIEQFLAQVPREAGEPSSEYVSLSPATLPQSVQPGQALALALQARAVAPWQFDPQPPEAMEAGVYPLAPAESWDAGHPVLKSSGEQTIAYEWSPQPRPQAQHPEQTPLQAVWRLPLVNTQSGEKKVLFLTQTIAPQGEDQLAKPAVSAAPTATPGQPHTKGPDSSAPAPVSNAVENQTGQPLSFVTGIIDYAGGEQTQRGVLYFLLLAFVGGLILNVMPCVLPVISIKILGFVRQGGQDPRRVFRLGMVFAAGVLVSFTALAAVVIGLKVLGTQVGWGFQFQEPRFVIALAAIVFAFGLSLLGVYSVELSARTAGALDGAAHGEGYASAFLNGVLATALATPCSAPFLGPALGFAFAQPAGLILPFFLMVGLGLALPYVVLSAWPGLVAWLPKPGAWMETFKQAMGVLLLGTVIWLLSVLGSQTGAAGIVWTLCFLLGIAVAAWLVGQMQNARRGGAKKALAIAAALIVVAGYGLFPERYLRTLAAAGPAQTTVASPAPAVDGQLAWEPFSIPRLESLIGQQRTVFVDFTADWCLTCKANEHLVLETGTVRDTVSQLDVALLKADWTRQDPLIGRLLAQFGRSGVPMYVIFPAGRAEQPILLPTALTPDMVRQALRQAAQPQ